MKAYHVTWVTRNTRVSERMVIFGVKNGEPILLDEKVECEITSFILQIIQEDMLKVLAYATCQDHIHMVLVCEPEKLSNIVRKLKGKSTQMYKWARDITEPFHLWAQKFHHAEITNERQLENILAYVMNNRLKHGLPFNKGLQPLVTEMVVTVEEAFNKNPTSHVLEKDYVREVTV